MTKKEFEIYQQGYDRGIDHGQSVGTHRALFALLMIGAAGTALYVALHLIAKGACQ